MTLKITFAVYNVSNFHASHSLKWRVARSICGSWASSLSSTATVQSTSYSQAI